MQASPEDQMKTLQDFCERNDIWKDNQATKEQVETAMSGVIPHNANGILFIEVPQGVIKRAEDAQEFTKHLNAVMHTKCPDVTVMILPGCKVSRPPADMENVERLLRSILDALTRGKTWHDRVGM